jgi:ribonuclease R
VAASFRDRGENAVWRIHDAPDPGRLEQFAALAAHYGITIDVDEARTPRGLRRVLEKLRGHVAEKPLSFALLRSLKQATYDVVNVGHFGLASRDYLHFTSPIRRYPDLIVHRLLKIRLAGLGKPSGGWKSATAQEPPDRTELQRMASDASFAERSKMQAEREVVDIYRAYFMRDRIGDVFDGTISGVMGFGVFVVIDEPFIEGLVRVEALSDDYYLFDEVTARLVGRRSGRTFALGDTVKVEVQSVSVVRRKIDFALHEHRERQRRQAATDGRKGRGAREAASGGERAGRRRSRDGGVPAAEGGRTRERHARAERTPATAPRPALPDRAPRAERPHREARTGIPVSGATRGGKRPEKRAAGGQAAPKARGRAPRKRR